MKISFSIVHTKKAYKKIESLVEKSLKATFFKGNSTKKNDTQKTVLYDPANDSEWLKSKTWVYVSILSSLL